MNKPKGMKKGMKSGEPAKNPTLGSQIFDGVADFSDRMAENWFYKKSHLIALGAMAGYVAGQIIVGVNSDDKQNTPKPEPSSEVTEYSNPNGHKLP